MWVRRPSLLMFGLALAGPAWSLPPETLRPAALSGDAEAAFALGRAYKMGDGVRPDNREAEHWFEKAARLGHAKAGPELGMALLQNGKGRDALPWLRKAAERGDARAQYGLATLLFSGQAGTVDKVAARGWMRRAARAGLPAASEALAVMDDAPVPPRSYQIVTVEPVKSAPKPGPDAWRVQLGAFARPGGAERQWRMVAASGVAPIFAKTSRLTLLQAGPFASREAARRFCAAQRERGRDCFEIRGSDGTA